MFINALLKILLPSATAFLQINLRRYMALILLIRRKTLTNQSFNQSIKLTIVQRTLDILGYTRFKFALMMRHTFSKRSNGEIVKLLLHLQNI